ncbi:MAG: hypothetical protein IKD29_09240 [Lentisphaeria bacterium]|nr:hypothetical protein [Lentisphaeria bacterium]
MLFTLHRRRSVRNPLAVVVLFLENETRSIPVTPRSFKWAASAAEAAPVDGSMTSAKLLLLSMYATHAGRRKLLYIHISGAKEYGMAIQRTRSDITSIPQAMPTLPLNRINIYNAKI